MPQLWTLILLWCRLQNLKVDLPASSSISIFISASISISFRILPGSRNRKEPKHPGDSQGWDPPEGQGAAELDCECSGRCPSSVVRRGFWKQELSGWFTQTYLNMWSIHIYIYYKHTCIEYIYTHIYLYIMYMKYVYIQRIWIMCMYTYTHVYTYICTYRRICMHRYMCIQRYIHISVHAHVR